MEQDVLSYKKKPDPTPTAAVPEPILPVYQANLGVLQAVNPDALVQLKDHPETPLPIDPNLKVQGLKNPSYLVIIGFAGPQTLQVARASGKDINHVLIIEPDWGHFHQAIRRHYIGDLLQDESVDFLLGVPPHELIPYLYKTFVAVEKKQGNRTNRAMQPEVLVDPFAYPPKEGKHPAVVEAISKAVFDGARQVFLSMGCASDTFNRWEQMIRNEENLAKSYRIAPLFEKFSDIPTVVLGAGPSLEGFIDAYHKHSLVGRCVIIACDAGLRKLLDHGIRPHFVTRCERKLTTIFHNINKEDTRDIYYTAYPWCSPDYFDLFQDSILMFRGNGTCKWTGYDPGEVNGGVSSANAGLEIAFLLGAKKIIMAGVDLCFIDGKSHTSGTEVEFDIEKSRPKWQTIPGNSGPVTTIPVWYRCLNEYQGALVKHAGKAEVFNTSKLGAQINGTKLVDWDEAATHFGEVSEDPLTRIKKYLEKHPPNYAESLKANKDKTLKALKSALHDLKKLFLNVDDSLIISAREEQKVVQELKSFYNPQEFFANFQQYKKNLSQVYQEPARQVDQFKFKWYREDLFAGIIIDICQLNYFQIENKIAGLKNLVDLDHERLRLYVHYHLSLYRTFEYYMEKMIELLEKGPNLTYEIPAEVKELTA